MIVVRCKNCNRELSSQSGKTQCCGCSNMMTLVDDVITAKDLGKVVMLNTRRVSEKDSLSPGDLQWQEERRKRKVRKLDFDVR